MKVLFVLSFIIILILTVASAKRSDAFFQKFPINREIDELLQRLQSGKRSLTDIEDLSSVTSIVTQQAENDNQLRLENIAFMAKADAREQYWRIRENEERPVPTLFHNYNASASVIFGTASFEIVSTWLEGQNYKPIALGQTDLTPVSIWIINHHDTSVGPYQELQIYFHVTPAALPYTLAIPFEENKASLLYPFFKKLEGHTRLYLWHSTVHASSEKFKANLAISFARETFGFPKELGTKCSIETLQSGEVDFAFADDEGYLQVNGRLGTADENTWSSWWNQGWKIFRAQGLGGIFDLRDAKYLSLKTVSPVPTVLHKPISSDEKDKFTDVYITMKKPLFRSFSEEKGDRLQIHTESLLGGRLTSMKFHPEYVVKMPLYQYAIAAPRDQAHDVEYSTSDIQLELVVDNNNPTNVIQRPASN